MDSGSEPLCHAVPYTAVQGLQPWPARLEPRIVSFDPDKHDVMTPDPRPLREELLDLSQMLGYLGRHDAALVIARAAGFTVPEVRRQLGLGTREVSLRALESRIRRATQRLGEVARSVGTA